MPLSSVVNVKKTYFEINFPVNKMGWYYHDAVIRSRT